MQKIIIKQTGRVQEEIEDFIKFKKMQRNITYNTEREYRRVLDEFYSLRKIRLFENEEKYVGMYISARLQNGEKPSAATWNRRRSYLHAFFEYCVQMGKIQENPVKKMNIQKQDESESFRQKIKIPEEKINAMRKMLMYEVSQAEGAAPFAVRNYLLFEILSFCGLRAGEAGSFAREDIEEMEKKAVGKSRKKRSVYKIQIKGSNTKTKRSRTVFLPQRLDFLDVFESYLAWHRQTFPDPSTPFLCVLQKNENGILEGRKLPARRIWDIIKRVFRQFGLGYLCPHDLRHFAITQLVKKNVSPALVMRISGHSSPQMLQRYTNITSDEACSIIADLVC